MVAVADLRAARDLDPSDATVAGVLTEAEEEVRGRGRGRGRGRDRVHQG